MNKTLTCFILMIASCSICIAENDDVAFWSWTSFNFHINESWKVNIREDFRFPDGSFAEYQNQLLLNYTQLPDYLDLGIGYRLIEKEDSHGDFRQENRPFIDLALKKEVLGLKLSDRSRLEYRGMENKDDAFRYRNQLKLSSSHDLFNLPLRPYIADEIFVQEREGFYRNWVRTGIIWDVNKRLDIHFFTIFQSEKQRGRWDDLVIGGIEMAFTF